jgi:hypothetical protein
MANENEEVKFDDLDMSAFSITQEQEIEETPEEEEVLPEETVEETKENTEEETPEEVGETDDDEETPDDEGESSQNLYSTLASTLVEEGVLPSLDSNSKIETVDDLIDAFRNEIKVNEYSGLNETQKEYLTALENGIPEEVVKQHFNTQAQLGNITEDEIKENEELRQQLIVQDFMIKGYNEEKAKKLAQRSIDIGEDVTDALDALDGIKVFEKTQYQKQSKEQEKIKAQKEAEDKKQIETFKKNVFDTKEIIPGVQISTQVAQKVYDQAMKPVATLENGQQVNALMKARMENPVDFETKLNYLFYVTKGFTDFSKIQKSQKRKAVESLDKVLQGNQVKPENTNTPKPNNEWSKILDNVVT